MHETNLMLRRVPWVLASVSIILFLSGCVALPDPEASQDYIGSVVGTVDSTHTVGQTVLARRPRLNGVELWLANQGTADPAATLTVELFSDPQATKPLGSANLSPGAIVAGRPVRVDLAAQAGLSGQPYYLRLKTSGATVNVLGRNEDAYPGGQAFVDGIPVEADLAFRLFYDYGAGAMLGDLLAVIPRVWLALPLAALLLLPGWLLLDLLGLRGRFDGGEQVALATGLSVALVPLALLWTSFVGLRWNRPAIVVSAVLMAAVAVWRLLRRFRSRKNVEPQTSKLELGGWALAGIFALSLAVRLAMVRDLVVPAWVDSVHHALIAGLIVDEGVLPSTYAPFVNVDTASYHAGFHGLVAAFHWLSGLDVAGALLLVGQVLNALVVPVAYLLAKDLTGDRVVGLVAALVVGLFSPMPAYYASWGRYTQLAGLLILPAAWVLTRQALVPRFPPKRITPGHGSVRIEDKQGERERKYSLLLAVVVLSGLVLTHYRVAAFFGCLLLAYLVGQRYGRGARWRHLIDDGLRLGLIGVGSVALTLPWFVPALTTLWVPKLQAWSEAEPAAFADFSWTYLTRGQGPYVLILALVGLGWALIERRRFALTLAVWVGLLFFLASLGVWGLPGGGFVNFVSVEITLFLPLSVLSGYVGSRLLAAWRGALPTQWLGFYRGAIALLLGGAMLFGAWTMLPILNADTVLMHQADEPAIAWIRDNTPPDARVLINPMPWSAYMYAGRDGGYWISPLAGRQTIPPPVLYGLGPPEEVRSINEICAAVSRLGRDPKALWSLLRESGITHVYIGARGGVLSAEALNESDHFVPLYAGSGTWVFEVLPQPP